MTKRIWYVLVMINIYTSLVATLDPLVNFAKNRETLLIGLNNDDMTVRAIHHTEDSIIIISSTEALEGFIHKYDFEGNLLGMRYMDYACTYILLEEQIQALWSDDCFYVPGNVEVLRDDEWKTAAVIQKFNYNLEVDEQFGAFFGAILLFVNPQTVCGFTSITAVNGKCFASGYIQNTDNIDEDIQSKRIIIDFDPVTGVVNHHYTEAAFTIGGTRKINFIAAYEVQGAYWVLATGATNNLIYTNLNENNPLEFGNAGIVTDTLIKIDDTQWYGINNNNKKLYLITVDWTLFPPVASAVVLDIVSAHPLWISSAAVVGNKLFLAGEYDITVQQPQFTPFVKVYDVSTITEPFRDTTVFNAEWSMNAVYGGVGNKSALDFFVNGPYSFLFGYRNSLRHITNFIGIQASLAARVSNNFTPWIS